MTDEPIAWDHETLNGPPMMTPDLIVADPEFLLRCALTYNWKVLLQFCGIILEVLTTASSDDAKRSLDKEEKEGDPADQQQQQQQQQQQNAKSRISDFSDDILQRDERSQRRLQAARSQLTQRDQWGNTPLHAACFNDPPLAIIKALLECASAAHPPIQLHTFLARDQSSALNIACATGATTRVIQALLMFRPPRLTTRRSASRTTRSRTPAATPKRAPPVSTAATAQPSNPLLHGGCMVCVADARGCTPFMELVVQYELQRQTPQWRRANTLSLDDVQDLRNDCDSCALLSECWSKVDTLLRSSWEYDDANHAFSLSTNRPGFGDVHAGDTRTNTSRDPAASSPTAWMSILHAAANTSHAIPASLAHLVCRTFANKTTAKSSGTSHVDTGDESQQLNGPHHQQHPMPLHLAISSMYKPNYSPFKNSSLPWVELCSDDTWSSFRDRQSHFVQTLVSMQPDCVRHDVPISAYRYDTATEDLVIHRTFHRSPLCYAISRGLQWHAWKYSVAPSSTGAAHGTCANVIQLDGTANSWYSLPPEPTRSPGPLQCLYRRHPDALMTRDPITGLYPFALAATVRNAGRKAPPLASDEGNDTDGEAKDGNRQVAASRSCDDEDDSNLAHLLQLDTVYNLLRLHPQLLHEAVPVRTSAPQQ